jgi:phytoene dehydrogenase-like protein
MIKVIIIGAGIGGLATAARMARKDYQVTLLEKGRSGVPHL